MSNEIQIFQSRPYNLRRDARKILDRALAAADPERLFREKVRIEGRELVIDDLEVDLSRFRRIKVVGTGKGAAPMARAAEDLFADRLHSGAITVKYGHALPLKKIEVYEAAHPLPDDSTVVGTQRILKILEGSDGDDLIIVLLTGGGSALLELPVSGISLQDLIETTRQLLSSGATITEINSVRKHLSQVKGGQLLRAAAPAHVITLAISDVIGDQPDAIASGPTVGDLSIFDDAWQVIQEHSLENKLPPAVLKHVKDGCSRTAPETPKPGDAIFGNSSFRIIGNNRIMLEAAWAAALESGYDCRVLTGQMQGEAAYVGRKLARMMAAVRLNVRSTERPLCLLAGGETTVTLRGEGLGGRNQELALAAAIHLDGMENRVLLAAGSDGTDGPTEAAGAIVDGFSLARAREKNLDPDLFLRHNDSYNFFKSLGDLVITGPTRTNVMDIVIMFLN